MSWKDWALRGLLMLIWCRQQCHRWWYWLWPDQVWITLCLAHGQCPVTLALPLFYLWRGETLYQTLGLWSVTRCTRDGCQQVAYRGTLRRAWEVRSPRADQDRILYRRDLVLRYRGQPVAYDLGVLDGWQRLSEVYGATVITHLDRVFQILGWQVDEVALTEWDPYSCRRRSPGALELRDLYEEGPSLGPVS